MRVFVVFLILLFLPAAALSSDVCDNISLSKIMPYMPPDYRIISKKPLGDVNLCDILVEVDGRVIPVYANSKIAIVGSLFKNGVSVSDEEVKSYLDSKFRHEFDLYGKELKNSVVCSYYPKGVSKDKYFYFIVDPNCPFSNNIKSDVKKLSDELGLGVKLIFVNKYSGSDKKISSFICNGKGFVDYLNDNYGKNKTCKKAEIYINKTDELVFEKLNLKDTPTFITKTGKKESGINLRILKKLLQ